MSGKLLIKLKSMCVSRVDRLLLAKSPTYMLVFTVSLSSRIKVSLYIFLDVYYSQVYCYPTSGIKKSGLMDAMSDSLCAGVLARLRRSNNERILRECLMGTSDMNSTPPATITSKAPAAIMPTPIEKYC